MTCHSNLVVNIASSICRASHLSGLFDDLCQVGEITAKRFSHMSQPYVAKAVRHAMLKIIPKRPQKSLGDVDFQGYADIEFSPEFYVNELQASNEERQIFTDHYINNISVNEIAQSNKISVSAVYRILSRLRKDLANVI